MAPVLVSSAVMTDRRVQRLSLLIACAGTLAMLAAAVGRLDIWIEWNLPGFETSRPALPDWPSAPKARHAV